MIVIIIDYFRIALAPGPMRPVNLVNNYCESVPVVRARIRPDRRILRLKRFRSRPDETLPLSDGILVVHRSGRRNSEVLPKSGNRLRLRSRDPEGLTNSSGEAEVCWLTPKPAATLWRPKISDREGTHTPLVQSENSAEGRGGFHGKRGLVRVGGRRNADRSAEA